MGAYKRIMIVGPPGSGKTTLARQLSRAWGLPLVHIDRLFFSSGWRHRPEFVADHEALLQEEHWVADGNATRHFGPRAERAELLIYLHPPRLVCIWRILKRRWKYHGRHRADRPDNCPEQITWELLRYTWQFEKHREKRIRQLAVENPHLEVITWRKCRPFNVDLVVES